jgi:hypothetical protein
VRASLVRPSWAGRNEPEDNHGRQSKHERDQRGSSSLAVRQCLDPGHITARPLIRVTSRRRLTRAHARRSVMGGSWLKGCRALAAAKGRELVVQRAQLLKGANIRDAAHPAASWYSWMRPEGCQYRCCRRAVSVLSANGGSLPRWPRSVHQRPRPELSLIEVFKLIVGRRRRINARGSRSRPLRRRVH